MKRLSGLAAMVAAISMTATGAFAESRAQQSADRAVTVNNQFGPVNLTNNRYDGEPDLAPFGATAAGGEVEMEELEKFSVRPNDYTQGGGFQNMNDHFDRGR